MSITGLGSLREPHSSVRMNALEVALTPSNNSVDQPIERSIVENELQALLDERAIRRVLATYVRGVDRLDVELIRSAYHPDGVDEHSSAFSGLGVDLGSHLVRTFNEKGFISCSHQLTNSTIELRGEEALVETYFIAVHQTTGGNIDCLLGRYLDRFERRDGVWKIAHRLVVHDIDHRIAREPVFEPGKFFAYGRQDREDASYAHLAFAE